MYDDTQVRAILQRALELDVARSGRLTRDELLQIGAEVGVSRVAMEEAIAELADGGPALPVEPARQPMRLTVLRVLNLTTAVGIAGGLLSSAGWTVGGMRTIPIGASIVGTLSFGALLMLSGGLALSDPGKSIRRYLEENVGIWLGFGFGGVLAGGLIAKFGSVAAHPNLVVDAGIWASVIGFAVSTVVGTTLLTIRRMSGAKGAASAPTSGDGPGSSPPLLARIATKVRRWLRRWDYTGTARSRTAPPMAPCPNATSAS